MQSEILCFVVVDCKQLVLTADLGLDLAVLIELSEFTRQLGSHCTSFKDYSRFDFEGISCSQFYLQLESSVLLHEGRTADIVLSCQEFKICERTIDMTLIMQMLMKDTN